MSRKNIILLVLFLVIISCLVVVFLYTQNKNLTKSAEERTAEQIRQAQVMTELNSFTPPPSTETPQDVMKQLNSFKVSNSKTTTNTTGKNTSNTKTQQASGSGATTTPKTQTQVMQELNSFQPPAKSSSDTLKSLNSFNP